MEFTAGTHSTKPRGPHWFHADRPGEALLQDAGAGGIWSDQDEKTMETLISPLIRVVSSETVSP
jgi:hypothetical protein